MSWRHQRRETITRLVTVKSFQVIFVAGPGILKSGGRGKRHTSSREPIKEKIAANQKLQQTNVPYATDMAREICYALRDD
jgi:hypothetical protein